MTTDNTYQMNTTRENFSKLLTLLKVFENYCNDCDIQNGLLRCRTNDRQAVISMNLSSILATNSLLFSVVKNKIGLLKAFELDDNVQTKDKDNSIILSSNESNYEIHDSMSKMIFRKPAEKYIDNKFIPDNDFNTMINCEEANLIFSYDISNYLKKRISNISLGFQSDIIKCRLIETKGHLSSETRNHEDSAEFASDIVLNRVVGDKEFRMIAMPFILDVSSDLKLSVYETSSDVYMCRFDQSYYGVPINVYTQVKVSNL